MSGASELVERKAFSDWAWMKAGEAIGNLSPSKAAEEAWMARAAASRAEVVALREALAKLHHAVCGETGFASAVRQTSGLAYPWPALDEADELARAALAGEKPVGAGVETALRQFIYETTHLSPENDDGSHDCRISKGCLEAGRAALSKSGEKP